MTKNESGVYLEYRTDTLATHGRSRAEVRIARCDDGLFRHALNFEYSTGGFGGPVTDHGHGHAAVGEARAAGIAELLARFPTAWESEPQSVHTELRELREQIEAHLRQPSLF